MGEKVSVVIDTIGNQNRLFNRRTFPFYPVHYQQELLTPNWFLVLYNRNQAQDSNQDSKMEKTHENTVWLAPAASLYRYQYTYVTRAPAQRLWQQ